MNIRPETPRDYAVIGDLTVRAFGRPEEAWVIPPLRQRHDFDPELSLVAEIDGRIVGHALFSPYTIRLLGQDVRTVNLAPIAIEPDTQKQGIGGALINEGHRIAQNKGYNVGFLLGHDTYYPRFGYKTGVYGVSSVEISRTQMPPVTTTLTSRPPIAADGFSLAALSSDDEADVDFAIMPSFSLLDWVSLNLNIKAAVYLRGEVVVGYTRVHKDEPEKPRMFLAADHDAARAMAALLMGDQPSITLPLHPYSKSAEAFDVKPQVTPWNAAMACSLAPSPFDDYYAQLQAGTRLPGRVIWPVAFDLA
jgi:putative acetyltransferase